MNARPQPDDAQSVSGELPTLWAIFESGRRVVARAERLLDEIGLSLAKFRALRLLVQTAEPVSLGQLAQRAKCAKSNVTQLISRMEKENLLQRLQHPADRRAVLAVATDEGRRRYASAMEVLRAEEQRLRDLLSDGERQTLLDLPRKIEPDG